MPVYDHVHSKLCGVGYTVSYQLLQLFLITAGTITAVLRCIHGEADTIGIPVVPQGTEGIIIDILGEPGNTVGGHTVELDSVSVCTGQLPVLHMESAVLSVRSGVIDRGRLENCWFGFSGLCPGCFGGRCLFRGSGTFGDGFCDGSRRFRGSRCCGFIRRILPATASESTGA